MASESPERNHEDYKLTKDALIEKYNLKAK
jgi:hypothetical protein